MPDRPIARSPAAPTVVFDIDGTLLDSAPGIVAGFQHALRSVGFVPPETAVLHADLGPPVGQVFQALGVPSADLGPAVAAYRAFYLSTGLRKAAPYPGVVGLLRALTAAGCTVATATAKRTDIANAILDYHQLRGYFVVVNGTRSESDTKSETLARTLALLGGPNPNTPTNPQRTVMVGDRHSDITAAQDCGVLPVAVSWGYGSAVELQRTGATLIDHPGQLLELLLGGPSNARPTPGVTGSTAAQLLG